jgi:hypothetical protein
MLQGLLSRMCVLTGLMFPWDSAVKLSATMQASIMVSVAGGLGMRRREKMREVMRMLGFVCTQKKKKNAQFSTL